MLIRHNNQGFQRQALARGNNFSINRQSTVFSCLIAGFSLKLRVAKPLQGLKFDFANMFG